MKRQMGAALAFATLLGLHAISANASDVLTPCFLKVSLYTNISGTTVAELIADPSYPSLPSEVRFLRSFNTRDALPTDVLDNFGGRIEGFVTPLESGDYHFFLRSDDASQLWLSTDQTEANATMIAEELDSGDPFLEPDVLDAATSVPVTLTAGQRYFIMALYKSSALAGNSTDVAQVAWRKVGDTTPALKLRPIPGAFLSTLASDAQGPAITLTQQPQDVTAEENSQAIFSIAATVSPTNYVCIQWQRNGINIPGATGTNYTRFIDKADQGAKFRAVVAVPGAFTNSAEANVTLTDDLTRPVLVGAKGGPNRPEVTLTFSERLSASSATNLVNYQITSTNGTLGVTGAALSDDRTQVVLSTDAQTPGTQYTVTVNSVTDTAVTTPNTVAANSQAPFFALGPWLQGIDGFVVWEAEDYDRNLDGLWFRDTERGVPSGGVSMVNYNGAGGGENSTKLEYDILFSRTGTNIFWFRASGNDGNDDSVWLHLDGQRPAERTSGNLASISGFGSSLQSTWGWSTAPGEGGGQMTFVIDTPGLHTIGIARREDGTFVDKFVITTDPNFNPTTTFGTFGPPVTLRQGEPLPVGATVQITLHPVSTQAVENTSITLTAGATIPPGYLFTYQWQRKQGTSFVDIPRATLTNLTINPLKLDWNGAVIRMRVTAAGDVKYTDEATITVVPETVAPQLVRATGLAQPPRAVIVFSEPVTPATAQTSSSYTIDGPAGMLAVTAATLMPNGLTVVLDTGAQTVGAKYTVTVNGIADTAATPNLIVNKQIKFYSLGSLLPQGDDGLLVVEAESFDRNLDNLWVEDRVRGTPSGGASVVNPNGAGGSETATKVEYDLTFTKTGTNILWYRASGDSGNDDSIWLHLDGARPVNRTTANLASITGFGNQLDFVWRSNPQEGGGQMTFLITNADVHAISFARREDGSFLDKFIITTDPNFNPLDYGTFGPPETRQGAPPLPTLAVTSPETNAQFNVGASIPITVAISSTPRVISKVEFFSGTNRIGESLTSPFDFTWQNAAAGTHNLTAVLTDDVNDSVRSRMVPIVVAAPQISLTAASGAGGLILTWAGSAPPYTIETKTRLSDAAWTPVLTTNVTSALVPIQGESGFFRVTTP
jgi:hypothetical protein